MRQSEAAVALIRREQDGQTRWLARWNAKWHAFHLVAGHRHADESFRACLIREIGEELGLVEGEDYLAASEPMARLEFTAYSEAASAETRYRMELFPVDLRGGGAIAQVEADPENRWLSGSEIRRGHSADGHPISPTLLRLLEEISLLSEPEEGARSLNDPS